MKYMWSNNNLQEAVDVRTECDEFADRTEYNLNMMTNLQRTSPKKIKRFRSAFTTEQVNYLENHFKKFQYINNNQRKEVASALNIPERAVKIWFQNRRMKEKKETAGKGFNDEQGNRKSPEFTKDLLSNISTLSANDQISNSLPLLNDGNKANCDEIMVTNRTPCSLNTGLLTADSGFKTLDNGSIPYTINAPSIGIKPSQPTVSTSYMQSVESSIDLCKRYKREPNSDLNYSKDKEKNIKETAEKSSLGKKSTEQMIPEDLSSSRNLNLLTANQTQVPNIAQNKPGYISVIPTVSPFYAPPYYTASGVIWKPLNVMPTTPLSTSSISVPISSSIGPAPTIPESIPKKCCSCECHAKPLLPFGIQQQTASPQYLITAVQFPNPSVPKF